MVSHISYKVSGWYTLVIFTASMQEYADPVIDWLDAGRGILARRFFREVRYSCSSEIPISNLNKSFSHALNYQTDPTQKIYPW